MSPTMRVWNFATVLATIVVIALGWFLGAAPRLAEAAIFESERQAVQAQNDLTRIVNAQLESDFQNLDTLRRELALLRAQFPTQAAYDDALEELLTGLLAQGLTLQNISFAEPLPSVATVVGEGEADPTEVVVPEGELPRGSLLAVLVSVTVQGPLLPTLTYIDSIQRSTRFGLVSSVSYRTGGADGNAETTFTLNIYVISGEDLVDVPPVDAEPEPAPEGPAPTETPEPGATDPAATPAPGEPTPVPTP